MNGVTGHREIAHAYAHPIAEAHGQCVDTREHAAVPGPQVEFEHRVHPRRVAAGIDVEGIEQEHEIAVDRHELRILRVHHDKAHHAHRHLYHLVGVRVVHERAGFRHHELV